MPEQTEDARARLAEALWNDPETGPEMQRLVKKKFPQAPIPAHEMREQGKVILAEVDKRLAADKQERETERQRQQLEQARASIRTDPELHIRDEEIPAVEKLMQDELIGSHRAAARLYRAQQVVAPPRSEGYSTMDVPGMDGGEEFKWLTPAIGKAGTVLDKVTRKHAEDIIADFRAGRGQKWL